MKIILSGGDDEKSEEFKNFIGDLKDQNILYIPVAKKTRPYKDCLNWFSKNLIENGFKGKIKMITNLVDLKKIDLNEYQGMFIGGGSTYSLLEDIKKACVEHYFKKYLIEGGIIYGSSAGAMIFGKDISFSNKLGDKKIDMEDYNGLNLISGYSLWPHYIKAHDSNIQELNEKGIKLILIPSGRAITFKGSELNILI